MKREILRGIVPDLSIKLCCAIEIVRGVCIVLYINNFDWRNLASKGSAVGHHCSCAFHARSPQLFVNHVVIPVRDRQYEIPPMTDLHYLLALENGLLDLRST